MSLDEKVKRSIEFLKAFEPEEGYYLAFSGGKDSVVCKALLDMAGCKYDATYRVTSVDPPDLVRFIKEAHPDVKMEIPHYPDDYRVEGLRGKPVTMWNLIPHKLIPPTRNMRYCCSWLKESGGDGRKTVTGVRWAESVNRAKNQGAVTIADSAAGRELGDNPDFRSTRQGGVVLVNDNAESRRTVEQCYRRHKTTFNPIIDWEDAEVWEFICANGLPYCGLYDEGWHRLGCIGCPNARKHGREREFLRWPKYKAQYLRTFAKMIQERERKGLLAGTWRRGTTPEDVFNWWMEYDVLPGQIDMLAEDYEWEEDEP